MPPGALASAPQARPPGPPDSLLRAPGGFAATAPPPASLTARAPTLLSKNVHRRIGAPSVPRARLRACLEIKAAENAKPQICGSPPVLRFEPCPAAAVAAAERPPSFCDASAVMIHPRGCCRRCKETCSPPPPPHSPAHSGSSSICVVQRGGLGLLAGALLMCILDLSG
ncbi:hypothetical protein VTO73DRAFT_8436 [Trametes versicolor]